jgi:hypothetical protein
LLIESVHEKETKRANIDHASKSKCCEENGAHTAVQLNSRLEPFKGRMACNPAENTSAFTSVLIVDYQEARQNARHA